VEEKEQQRGNALLNAAKRALKLMADGLAALEEDADKAKGLFEKAGDVLAAALGYPSPEAQEEMAEALRKALQGVMDALNRKDYAKAKDLLEKLLGQYYGYSYGYPYAKPKEGEEAEGGESEPGKVTETVRAFEAMRKEGKVWEVTIIRAGLSLNNNYYPPEVLQEAAPLFEGVKVFDSHLNDEEWRARRQRKVKEEYLGWIDQVRFDEAAQALRGLFHVVDPILREKMKSVWEAGRRDEFGFSIDAGVDAEPRLVENQRVNFIKKILAVNSVDVVFDPAAGGRMERMVENKAKEVKEMTKDELLEALKELSDEERKELLEGLTPAEEEAEAGEAEPQAEEAEAEAQAEAETQEEAGEAEAEEEQPVTEELELRLYRLELKEELAESGLPKAARDFLWEQFSGRPWPMEEVRKAIEGQRQVLSSVTQAGQVRGMGGLRITARPVIELDGFQLALERMLGVLDEDQRGKAPKIYSLREWYVALTGDDQFLGVVAPERVTEANVTTSSVTSIVKNVLNKRILKQWETLESKRWWEPIVTHYDEDTINDVTVYQTYGIGALDTVNEGAAYTEVSWGDYEETASFSKKGNYIGITLETFMRDNLNALRRIPDALTRAFLYTVSDLVSTVFTSNSGEGVTLGTTSRHLCNSTDGNLGSSALSYAAFDAAQTALAKLTEAGSGRRLGIYAKYLLVPIDLRSTAYQIRDSERDPDNAENGVNVWRGQFEVIVVPQWTDTNNWYLIVDPKDMPIIGLHWYRGQRTPQLFQAENETTGALFTNDEIRYKVRFWVARSVADYRGVYGSVVS